MVFSSAYIANDATLSTLRKLFPGLIIYSDELNHASMIEGIKRFDGAKRIFRHNDLAHLEELLEAGFEGAEYDAWLVEIFEGEQFGSGFVAINPNSKIPAMVDRSFEPKLIHTVRGVGYVLKTG